MRFPYRSYEVQPTPWFPDGIVHRPMVPLRVVSGMSDTTIVGLVDTGADETVLPDFLVRALGVNVDPRRAGTFRGVGGQSIQGVFGDVTLELGQGRQTRRWDTTVAFVSGPTVAILGQHGFLELFRATFDGEKRELTLTPARATTTKRTV